MVRTKALSHARTHLARLGTVLERRGWRVRLTTADNGPLLTVTDPDNSEASEVIACRRAGDGTLHYMWGPDRERRVAPVGRAHFVANRIHVELRGINDPDRGRR